MNILGWHVPFRRTHNDRPSPFAGVLPRVRTMREHCDWQSSTTPASREQRRERILQARQKLVYRPVPHAIAPDLTPAPGRTRWLWLAGAFALSCALVWALLTTDWSKRPVSRTFSY